MEKNNNNTAGKLGVIGLAAIVISSMIGGGIFSLPQNMAQGASVGVILIAWLITGIGMYFIANTFSILSEVKPDLTSGIYMYARDGFGPFTGFTIGWGYWLSQIFGNVGYAVITMDALNYFFPPHFAGGNNLLSIFCGSLLIWFFNFVVLRGVRQAAIMNIMGTIGKLVPLAIFIILLIFAFHFDKFNYDFWGHLRTDNLGPFSAQLKSTMLVTLWAFIGIEGAVVLSNRAKSQNEVSKATFLGFIGCLVIYVLLSVLPFGFMDQEQIAKIANPSTAGILEKLVGPWGSWLMNIGLLIAVLFSWLAWTMISAEIPFAAAKNGTFPRQFATENKNGAPSVSLWVTSAIMQLAILMVYFSNNAWNTMLSITGVMVLPAYIASTMYLWKLTRNGEYEKVKKQGKCLAVATGILGSVYGFWLIYAAGLKYLFMAFIFLALGIPFFILARKQAADGKPCFSAKEKGSVLFILVVAVAAIIAFASGWLKI